MQRKVYGYARVSTVDQSLERQLELLKEYVVDPDRDIYQDKMSGKDFNREDYKHLLRALHKGDLLVIVSLDRLGRNYTEIREQWEYITTKIGADIKVLDMPLLDTSTSTKDLDRRFLADLVLQILSYTAEKERENIRKRQQQGIDIMPTVDGKRISLKTGNPTGRPSAKYPERWKEVYQQWKNKEITANRAMEILKLKRTTFYKLVKRFEIN